ncbi:hypothetical protein ACVGXN_01605 [Enterobacter hormaechei]|uniref:hypothetical protein n=1 Tax=Enterobacter hormaechei TaxID=158836 RepID=UPI00066579DD|nr:hypothetical protein [Enterobacter hormaechei]HBO0723489.1 hypothetical protein [Enterobacter hormaechei subsp. xiangfangensis]EKS6396038.1 hypothetical protein [Enterobacter hormaechei]ELC6550583.1 hypothetical protein [Enterobacter hormaechei]MCR4010435.1 hypothetical protein [Enterobacter hormaechei]SAH72028.1 Uncharacterised protein [Enterobacter hormaechei]
MTLTKEWLLKTIAELEEERDATPGAVNEDAAMALAAMKLALASLEAKSSTDDISDAELNAALLLHRLKVDGHSQLSDAFRAGFKYARRTAPPAPVAVPDDVMVAIQKVARIRLDLNDFDGDKRGIAESLGEAEEALIEVVNRRAAMLQGAKQTTALSLSG